MAGNAAGAALARMAKAARHAALKSGVSPEFAALRANILVRHAKAARAAGAAASGAGGGGAMARTAAAAAGGGFPAAGIAGLAIAGLGLQGAVNYGIYRGARALAAKAFGEPVAAGAGADR